MHTMWQEVSKLSSLGSKNPRTFVTETFKVGIIKFQGFCVSVTSYFHHFLDAHYVTRGFKLSSLGSKNPRTFVTETF